MQKRLGVYAAALSLTSAMATANDIAIDLNPDTFSAEFDAQHASNGLAYSGAIIVTDDEGQLITINARTDDNLSANNNVGGGFGAKAYLIDDDDTYAALGVGGKLYFSTPELNDVRFSADFYYTPGFLTKDEIDNVIDLTLRVEYQLFENSAVYVGYRKLEADAEEDVADHDIDSNIHIGFKLNL